MKHVTTNDGSVTLHSEEYEQTYHSTSGALEEAQKKFVEPCDIHDGMTILDIGFGLGYNVGMALHHANNLTIISLEKDKKVLAAVQDLTVPDWLAATYKKVQAAARDLHYKDSACEITITVGDATDTIQQLPEQEQFDAVFLDAFSPPKNPELWTTAFFRAICKRMKPGAVLATYSCAGHVRRALQEAGFRVRDGPRVGRRSPSTIAVKEITQ